jgi:hypothetical protein
MPNITTSTIGAWGVGRIGKAGGAEPPALPTSVRRAAFPLPLSLRSFSQLIPPPALPHPHTTGFPRIGPKREMKKALEA